MLGIKKEVDSTIIFETYKPVVEMDAVNGKGRQDFTLDESTLEFSSTSITEKKPVQFKKDINVLNNRLEKYMNHVKSNEIQINEAEACRKIAEEQILHLRQQHKEQVDMLRAELEQRLRQTVSGEEQLKTLRQELETIENKRKILRGQLSEARKREASLDRHIIAERSSSRHIKEELAQLEDRSARERDNANWLLEQSSTLKVENVELQANIKNATFELTVRETKANEAEKNLMYSTDDVNKKLLKERDDFEQKTLKELNSLHVQFDADVAVLKENLQKDFEKRMTAFVSSEQQAKLTTELLSSKKNLSSLEGQIQEKKKILSVRLQELDASRSSYTKLLEKERRRSETLERKIKYHKQGYEDIRNELETYRSLIESLKIGDDSFGGITPIGSKRSRPSFMAEEGKSDLRGCSDVKTQSTMIRRFITPKKRITKDK